MLDFSKPMKMELTGERVRHICSDVVEIGFARVCVDSSTGIIYSGPHIGHKVINSQSDPTPPAPDADGETETSKGERYGEQ